MKSNETNGIAPKHKATVPETVSGSKPSIFGMKFGCSVFDKFYSQSGCSPMGEEAIVTR